ncbi:MAG TPA: uroporphyrinogen decarboxylase family protein [Steroidobacteraceae bacterium]|jgi:uroporphyrinogen decarboxylase|nr:uroporphyrinogen decarboxylase family protein [Steroidobacteraceae bacterium]
MKNLLQSALARCNASRPPVWFMRQAGRYHSHYRQLRGRHSFEALCKQPALATEVTLGPIEDFDFDAAILFSDLLFPLEALGMPLKYDPGPQLGWHVRRHDDLQRLVLNDASVAALQFQGSAMRSIRERLPDSKGLLGFVGGPLTLFFYAAAGSHQGDLGVAHAGLADGRYAGFCEKLLPLLTQNILLQWRAGADCIAIFDTCAGELGAQAFGRWVVPQLTTVVDAVRRECPEARILYYSKGTDATHWRLLTDLKIDGIGVDWRTPLADVLHEFGAQWAVQGNIDPHTLLLPEADFLRSAEHFLSAVAALPAERRRGWICGLGHGVLPATPENHVRLFVDLQRELFT